MSANTLQQPISYVLGHSDQELDRLSRQAELFGPFTRQLFEQAGITSGMRVLDIGCGAGDGAFLAADLVGATGEIVAVWTVRQQRWNEQLPAPRIKECVMYSLSQAIRPRWNLMGRSMLWSAGSS